jgi:hypothetical protein
VYLQIKLNHSGGEIYGTGSAALLTEAGARNIPVALPPQAAPAISSVSAFPIPACVISWAAVDGATGYKLYRSTTGASDADFDFAAPLTTVTALSHIDTTVSSGGTYWYKAGAINGNGEGEKSAAVSITITFTEKSWTAGIWTTETLASGASHWYTITTPGTYLVQWNDSHQGSGAYTCDVKVSAWRYSGGSLSALFSDVDSGYTSPRSVTVNAGDTVYVKVAGYYTSSSGNYAIQYYQQ